VVGGILVGAGLTLIAVVWITALLNLITARLFGLNILGATFGRVTYIKVDGKWRRYLAGSPLSLNAFASVEPSRGSWTSGQLRGFILTPGLVLLLLSLPGWLLGLYNPPDNGTFGQGLLAGMTIGLALGALLHLVPYKVKSQPSAMFVALKASDPKFVRNTTNRIQVIRMTQLPMRPREWKKEPIDQLLTDSEKASFDLWIFVVGAAYYFDVGDVPTAMNILSAGADVSLKQQLPLVARAFWFEFAFAHAWHIKDYSIAKATYDKAVKISGNVSKATQLIALAAIKLLENDLEAAENACRRSREELLNFLGPSDPRLAPDFEDLGRIEEAIRAHRSAPVGPDQDRL
jgi:hypothetical protein